MSPNTHYIVTKAVLLNQTGKVLILKRHPLDDHRPGEWDLPGGSTNENETIYTAIVREIKEETGIELSVHDFRIVYTKCSMRDKENVIMVCFSSAYTLSDDINLSQEHTEYKWVNVLDAARLLEGSRWGEALRYLLDNQLVAA